MRERPILFSAPMVRAILAGTKIQTRRIIKPQPDFATARANLGGDTSSAVPVYDPLFESIGLKRGSGTGFVRPNIRCPYGAKLKGWSGDRLWVKEEFAVESDGGLGFPPPFSDTRPVLRSGDFGWEQPHYVATDKKPDLACGHEKCAGGPCERPWKSPLFMPRWASRITLEIVSVRVERLQEISEADAIAEGTTPSIVGDDLDNLKFRAGYQTLWESINGPGSWAANPWVWVVEFTRVVDGDEATK